MKIMSVLTAALLVSACGVAPETVAERKTTATNDGKPIGFLDSVADGTVSGWACDPDTPAKNVQVHIYVGGPAGKGHGYPLVTAFPSEGPIGERCTPQGAKGPVGKTHRFRFTIPNWRDKIGQPVYAYAINTGAGGNAHLSGSHKSLTKTSSGRCNVIAHSGHEQTALLADKANWNRVASTMDGFWIGTPTFRKLDLATRTKIANHARTKNCVGEVPFSWIVQSVYHNDVAAAQAGMDVNTLMIYEEHQWGSTLTPSQIAAVRKLHPNKQLLLNVRLWAPAFKLEGAVLTDVLHSVEGFSYEFGMTTDTARLDNVAAAIRWGIDNNKRVYLLTPPNRTTHVGNGNQYYKDYRWAHDYIKKKIGTRYFNSRFGWVPTNYAWKDVKVGPESVAGTQLGVARWLTLVR